MKKYLPIIISALFLLVFPLTVLAAGFQLTGIGSLDITGVTYDQIWYTSGSVTFTGTSTASSEVTATIGDTSEIVTADADGNWTYSTSLADGDHSVSFSSDAGSRSLTLTIGETLQDGVASVSASQTPVAGTITPTIFLFSTGLLLIVSPLLLKRRV